MAYNISTAVASMQNQPQQLALAINTMQQRL
jgi:hypothetical protein